MIFSCFGVFQDNWCNNGYSFAWLFILYVIGAILKKNNIFHKIKSLYLVMGIFVMCVISWSLYIFFGIEKVVSYISPTILINAVLLVELFSRIKIKASIKKISSLSLGIYLFQNNKTIWEQVLKNNVVFIGEYNIIIGLLLLFVTTCLLFFVGMFVDYVRKKLFNLIKIDNICKYIVQKFNKLFNSIIELMMED